MKLRYLIVILISLTFFGSCKSKKRVAERQQEKRTEHVKETTPVVKSKSTKPVSSSSNSPIKNATLRYIETYKNVAMEEMKVFHIPASITLAQGILESGSGNSELTKKSNNHFGIKCHKGWKGKKAYHDDDKKGECFRVYKNPKTSFRDHSTFLAGRERYRKLFDFDRSDYQRWAKGLSQAGYATDRRYPAKLIALIEKYNLDQFDAQVLGKKYKKTKRPNSTSDVHVVVKGDTLYSISKRYGLTVDSLKKINRLKSNTISIGQSLQLKK